MKLYKGIVVKVYFISGIGADHRVFIHLRLPEGFEPVHLCWIPPLKNERLADYASRLAGQIDTSEPFALVGLSLGGIMAVEIAKRIPPVCTILISSVPLSAHLPRLYRLAGALRLGKLIPATILKSVSIFKHTITMHPAANRKLICDVIRAGDDNFIRWALEAVLEWQNDTRPSSLFHLHGTRDEVFPIRLTTPTHIVPRGGHMFLLTRPSVVNQILQEVLTTATRQTPA